LGLSEKRILRSEVFQGTYYREKCDLKLKEPGFSLKQEFLEGPARTIRFGVGASTELGPMARVRWANNRYGSMASKLEATLQASFRSQSLNLSNDQFFWSHRPRQSLLTQVELLRESQLDYEQLVTRLKPHMKWTRDFDQRFWSLSLGPGYETGHFFSKANSSTRSFSTVALEGNLEFLTHDYEFFDFHPEEGEQFSFYYDLRHPALGFSNPLLKLDSSWAKLLRLGYLQRGTIVGGVRVNAATTAVSNNVSLSSLPPTVKFYGGGSDDVRGFFLRTLPKNNGAGALSKIGMKLEVRKTYFFQPSIEAFTFLDAAQFGETSWKVEERIWYSPGIGLRWLSPVGLVQGYYARARTMRPNADLGNFFYLGFGGQF
jgi:translocation and assembly module TamA